MKAPKHNKDTSCTSEYCQPCMKEYTRLCQYQRIAISQKAYKKLRALAHKKKVAIVNLVDELVKKVG